VFPLLSIKDRSLLNCGESRTVLAGHMPKGKPCGLGDSLTKNKKNGKTRIALGMVPNARVESEGGVVSRLA
jgi:hypothetical protein